MELDELVSMIELANQLIKAEGKLDTMNPADWHRLKLLLRKRELECELKEINEELRG